MTEPDVPDERVRPLGRDLDSIRRILARWASPAFLESGPGFGRGGRWSILAAEPRAAIVGAEDDADCLASLGREIERYGLDARGAPEAAGARFRGGLIGFLGYDLATRIEVLARRHPRTSALPDFWFGLYDTFVRHDRQAGRTELVGVDLVGEGAAAVEARLDRWSSRLEGLAEPPGRSTAAPVGLGDPPGRYQAGVRRVLDYLAAGDVFQVNLSRLLEAKGDFDPLDLYERLSRRSPAPYAALIGAPGGWLIGSSPELFYATRGRRIVTRPIKGTRPRGSSAAEDRRSLADLAASAKERAELAMIVDLERNDLGRVCEYGSVRVREPGAIESYAQVHHRVATIEGRLRVDVRLMDVVRAMFPGGSITGAPKIRAMEIIDELESGRRGPYTGAVGYYSFGCSMFNIAIRTIVLERGRLWCRVGGGIVADSDPEAEYLETVHKARGIVEVVEGRA